MSFLCQRRCLFTQHQWEWLLHACLRGLTLYCLSWGSCIWPFLRQLYQARWGCFLRNHSHNISLFLDQSVTHEEVHYTPKELLEFSNFYRWKSREYVWEWMLKVWDSDRRNIKLELPCGFGEGNGNPLQHSSLENPIEKGAWQAMVHGVSESWTQLSD